MGRFVIVAYRPHAGQAATLLALVGKHVEVLRAEQLISQREPYVMQAADGTVIEVFEWRSAEAIGAAHSNPAVLALWGEFASACDYVPLATLAECAQMFAEFDALSL